MMRLILTLAFLFFPLTTQAETMDNLALEQKILQLEDRTALKTLVDAFSNLADQKDVETQKLLFTENATVESFSDGKLVSSFKGRKQIGDAFSAYLANFETVYHINGQQTIELHGDRAIGVSYCLVVLIETDQGKKLKNTSGVIYNDEYVRRGSKWLIAKRTSRFTWRNREEMGKLP